jgi:hypothetical protein
MRPALFPRLYLNITTGRWVSLYSMARYYHGMLTRYYDGILRWYPGPSHGYSYVTPDPREGRWPIGPAVFVEWSSRVWYPTTTAGRFGLQAEQGLHCHIGRLAGSVVMVLRYAWPRECSLWWQATFRS